ncbi:uncharacterized protein LOC131953584 [Physella acuta]|uniref:uncharacterized protein LOC131953584 n=1 Tax=Physella acuta TaxID=109671 RepID=UPI0027DC4380|nr:uncharacterized protein LOC131953584 [Physella acuta]
MMSRHLYTEHSAHPSSDAEAYHHYLDRNKHLLLQIKMSVIFFVGGVIIVICVVYIFIQCRTKVVKPVLKQVQNRRSLKEDKKALFGSSDTLENLLTADNNSPPMSKHVLFGSSDTLQNILDTDAKSPSMDKQVLYGSSDTLENILAADPNSLPMKIRKDKEFYV